VLAIIAALSTGCVLYYLLQPPKKDTFNYELAKTSLQVLAVAVIGTLAALATFTFQLSRTQEAEHARERGELRTRQDAVLRSMLEDTLAAYASVKRVRRLLQAKNYVTLRVQDYDEHMSVLIDEQLAFERLKKIAVIIDDPRLADTGPEDGDDPNKGPEQRTLAARFTRIEEYLNDVHDEYREKRDLVQASGDVGVPLRSCKDLHAFVANASVFRGGTRSP